MQIKLLMKHATERQFFKALDSFNVSIDKIEDN